MPAITAHHSANVTKLMLLGDSGTGKTGALTSLVTAGYKLRILDLDNGLDILRTYLTSPKSPYYKELVDAKVNLEDAVKYVTLTETMRSVNGRIIPAKATVWPRAVELLQNWKTPEEELGDPRNWGQDCVLVIDSLSMLSTAALNYSQAMNGQLGASSSSKGYDMRADIGAAQNQIERLLQYFYDSACNTNVIIISHIIYRDPDGSGGQLNFAKRGYPNSIGVALAPRIPRYVNNILQLSEEGSGASTRHKIYTVSQGTVSLKSSAPVNVKPSYDIHNGLAEFFAAVRSET